MGVWDLLFPIKCVGCGRSGEYLCKQCLSKVKAADLICPVCSRSSFGGLTHFGCINRYALDGLVIIWDYEGVIKEAIGDLKFNQVSKLGEHLAEKVVASVKSKENLGTFRAMLVGCHWIGVPLHKLREKQRGYNQSYLLASELARRLGGLVAGDLVIRNKLTLPQVGLNKNERIKNMKGIFSLNKKYIGKLPRRVVVVDDVWTTGSTIQEVGKVLKESGVGEVWGLVLAR